MPTPICPPSAVSGGASRGRAERPGGARSGAPPTAPLGYAVRLPTPRGPIRFRRRLSIFFFSGFRFAGPPGRFRFANVGGRRPECFRGLRFRGSPVQSEIAVSGSVIGLEGAIK